MGKQPEHSNLPPDEAADLAAELDALLSENVEPELSDPAHPDLPLDDPPEHGDDGTEASTTDTTSSPAETMGDDSDLADAALDREVDQAIEAGMRDTPAASDQPPPDPAGAEAGAEPADADISADDEPAAESSPAAPADDEPAPARTEAAAPADPAASDDAPDPASVDAALAAQVDSLLEQQQNEPEPDEVGTEPAMDEPTPAEASPSVTAAPVEEPPAPEAAPEPATPEQPAGEPEPAAAAPTQPEATQPEPAPPTPAQPEAVGGEPADQAAGAETAGAEEAADEPITISFDDEAEDADEALIRQIDAMLADHAATEMSEDGSGLHPEGPGAEIPPLEGDFQSPEQVLQDQGGPVPAEPAAPKGTPPADTASQVAAELDAQPEQQPAAAAAAADDTQTRSADAGRSRASHLARFAAAMRRLDAPLRRCCAALNRPLELLEPEHRPLVGYAAIAQVAFSLLIIALALVR